MNKEQVQKFRILVGALSPENLYQDGELTNREALRNEKRLRKEWKLVEKEVGRKVTEDEIWFPNGDTTYYFEDETDEWATYDPKKIVRFDLYEKKWLTMKEVYPPKYQIGT